MINIININKIIDITKTQYYGKVSKTFTLRNDFFLYPPFHLYKILDDYDRNNIIIKERNNFDGDKICEGAGYEQYHDISFRTNGNYEIRIQNLKTNEIQKYVFTIYNPVK
jgi:hypothetical protein